MPKIRKEHVEALKEAGERVNTALAKAMQHFDALTASDLWKACKSYTNKYEGRIMKLSRRKKAKPKRKSTTK